MEKGTLVYQFLDPFERLSTLVVSCCCCNVVVCWWPLSCLILASLIIPHFGKIGISTCEEFHYCKRVCSGSEHRKWNLGRATCMGEICFNTGFKSCFCGWQKDRVGHRKGTKWNLKMIKKNKKKRWSIPSGMRVPPPSTG